MTPPCVTATTRRPARRAISSSTAGHDLRLEHRRVDAARVGPPPLDHGVPPLVLQLPQLLDRDVLVGVRVVLGDPVDDLGLEAERGRDRLRGLAGAHERARHDGVDRLVREPRREPSSLVATALR